MFERKGYVDDAEFDWTGRTMSTPVSDDKLLFEQNNNIYLSRFRTRIPWCLPRVEVVTALARTVARAPRPGVKANLVVLTFSRADSPTTGIQVFKFTGLKSPSLYFNNYFMMPCL